MTDTERLLALFDDASPQSIAFGKAWYPSARRFAEGLAEKHGLTVEQAAAVIAILSPQLEWGLNMAYAEQYLATGYAPTFDRTNAKLAAIVQTVVDPLTVDYRWFTHKAPCEDTALFSALSGPKVEAFYHAILNPVGTFGAVVDRHMMRAVGLDPAGPTLREKGYYRIANAIREAAALRDVPINVLQATVWCEVKSNADKWASDHEWIREVAA